MIRKIVLFCSVQPSTEFCPGTSDPLHKTRSVSAHEVCQLQTPPCRRPALPGPPQFLTADRANVRPCTLLIFSNTEQQKRCVGGVEGEERGGGGADLQGHYAKNPGSGSDLITRIKVTVRSRGGSKPIHKIISRNSAIVTKVI